MMFNFRRRPSAYGDRIAEIASRTAMDLDVGVLDFKTATTDGMPDWWASNGNLLLAAPGTTVPIVLHPKRRPPRNAIVILGKGAAPPPLTLWGDAPFVLLGKGTKLPHGMICCGDRSSIYLADHLFCNGKGRVDARNGGVIYVGPHGLWAEQVTIATDDMHRIFDVETGKRVNAFGSVVKIGEHVWLGQEVAVNPGATIGRDSVVGRRSIVTTEIPPNTLAVGTPARVIRSGINWSAEDLPD